MEREEVIEKAELVRTLYRPYGTLRIYHVWVRVKHSTASSHLEDAFIGVYADENGKTQRTHGCQSIGIAEWWGLECLAEADSRSKRQP